MMRNTACILFLALSLFSCYDYEEDYPRIDPSLNPVVEISRLDVPYANGVDSLNIRVYFPNGADLDSIKVNFTTTKGVFFENNKPEYTSSDKRRDSGRIYISANLRTITSLDVFYLTVEVPGIYKRTSPIRLRPSYPTTITTSKNKFAVERSFSDEIQLIANLKAAQGLPHEGTEVEFIVADTLSSNSSRHFRSLAKTDANGQASVYFTPGTFNGYTGPVSYKAISANGSGGHIEASGTFEVIN